MIPQTGVWLIVLAVAARNFSTVGNNALIASIQRNGVNFNDETINIVSNGLGTNLIEQKCVVSAPLNSGDQIGSRFVLVSGTGELVGSVGLGDTHLSAYRIA